MAYTFQKILDQELSYLITTENNGEEITFNVVCAKNESELDDLVTFHLNFLNTPTVIPSAPPEPTPPTAAELMAELQALTAKINALGAV